MTIERQLFELHNEAHKLAFSCYIRQGIIPTILTKVMAATESLEAFMKYCEDQPRNPAGSPNGTGGQWCKYPESHIKKVEDAEKIVKEFKGKYVGKNKQCASLTHALAPELPTTPDWKPGTKVQGNSIIPVGTPIATFNFQGEPNTNGYGSEHSPTGVPKSSHTGIYLGKDDYGVKILHQWETSHGPRINTIPWDAWNGNIMEGGSRYYTIDY